MDQARLDYGAEISQDHATMKLLYVDIVTTFSSMRR